MSQRTIVVRARREKERKEISKQTEKVRLLQVEFLIQFGHKVFEHGKSHDHDIHPTCVGVHQTNLAGLALLFFTHDCVTWQDHGL